MYKKQDGLWTPDIKGEQYIKKNTNIDLNLEIKNYIDAVKTRTTHAPVINNINNFIISYGLNLDYTQLRHVLNKRKTWKEINDGDTLDNIGFAYYDGNKRFWKPENIPYLSKPDVLRNILLSSGTSILDNKYFLYLAYVEYTKKRKVNFMFPSIMYSKTEFDAFYNSNKTYIIKPIGGYSGYGIQVSNQKDVLERYVNELIKKGLKHVMISEYLTNPLLFNNKKFHIRTYYLPYVKDNIVQGFMPKKGFIYTAKKDWINDNYDDTYIHDSHFWKTDKDYFYPDALYERYDKKKVRSIEKQIITILVIVNKYFRKFAFPYPESNYAYEMFGCDFMVDDVFNVKLLEINFNPTQATKTKENGTIYSKYLFEGIASNIVDDIFPSKIVSKKKNFKNLGKYKVSDDERLNPCKIM